MKKVVRLTESDLERIIKKVISEQMASGVAFGNEGNGFKMKKETKEQATQSNTQQSTDKTGVSYKMPPITDENKLNIFWNFPSNNYCDVLNYMLKLGIKIPDYMAGANPFTVCQLPASKQSEIWKNSEDKRVISADNLARYFQEGLKAVSKTGYIHPAMWKKPEFRQAWLEDSPKNRSGNKITPESAVSLIPNYWDVLAKLVQDQLRRIS
jgi:hypothetical protein